MPLSGYLEVSKHLDSGFSDLLAPGSLASSPLASSFLAPSPDRTPSLMLLIGLPGSGKSTLARELQAIDPNYTIVSTDAIRQQLFGDESIQGAWELIWAEVQRQLRQAIYSMEADPHLQVYPDHPQVFQRPVRAVIYDATNVVRCDRRRLIETLRSIGFRQITGFWLDTPLELCLQRNQNRCRQVPEAVIQRMCRRLTGAPPSLAEGLDCLIRYPQNEAAIASALGKVF
jgi:predicted kinase